MVNHLKIRYQFTQFHGIMNQLPIPQIVKRSLQERVEIPIAFSSMVFDISLCGHLDFKLDITFFKTLKEAMIIMKEDGFLVKFVQENLHEFFLSHYWIELFIKFDNDKLISFRSFNDIFGRCDILNILQKKGIPLSMANLNTNNSMADIRIVSHRDPMRSFKHPPQLDKDYVEAEFLCKINMMKSPKKFNCSTFMKNLEYFSLQDMQHFVRLDDPSHFHTCGRTTYEICSKALDDSILKC